MSSGYEHYQLFGRSEGRTGGFGTAAPAVVTTPSPAPSPATPSPAPEQTPPPWWATNPPTSDPDPAPATTVTPAVVAPATTPTTPAPDPEKAAETAIQRRTRSRIGTVVTSWRGVLNPDTAVPGRKRLLGE
ncbi:MAG: hypothetical protein K2X91_09435 [Thermoleophilia bacterium]|nr:hypothetical protein [Thermoleophilia bacterium]